MASRCVSRVLIRARMSGDGVSAPKWQGEAPARKALSRLSSRSRINKTLPAPNGEVNLRQSHAGSVPSLPCARCATEKRTGPRGNLEQHLTIRGAKSGDCKGGLCWAVLLLGEPRRYRH